MFTGIITALGEVSSVTAQGAGAEFGKCVQVSVAPASWLADVRLGDSISINGACMTVTQLSADTFSYDISAESLRLTAGLDVPGRVNLEKALAAQDRLGGHLVSGHVDGLGCVSLLQQVGESWELKVKAPLALGKFFAYKGSVTVHGVSLTVNSVTDLPDGCEFSINMIPHTARHTNLGALTAGSFVNLEIDVVARYLERMLTAPK